MKVGIYTRVSTENQSVDMQLVALRQYAKQRGFEVYKEYSDITSGSKSSRPALNELMEDARKRIIDVVLVWKFDRFARSVKQLTDALIELNHLGVEFISYTENIDTSSPTGKVLFTIISAMAEFERSLIVERVKAGIENARAKGRRIGRPTLITEGINEKIRELSDKGHSVREVAKQIKISASLVHKTLKFLKSENIENKGSENEKVAVH